MPTRTFYAYGPDALEIDPETGQTSLASDYNARDGRTRIEVEDNDNFADGDGNNDEVGDDADQTATVYDTSGNTLDAGRIYVEEVRWYETSDGEVFSVHVLEIDGEVVGYVPSEPMQPGESYTFVGSTDSGDKMKGRQSEDAKNQYNFYEQNSVACFGPGTMIATQEGDMPVEWLETSDLVLTRDNGYQPILWIGRTRLDAGYFRQYPDEAPLSLPAGSLANGTPVHDLCLTGDHRVLLCSARAELLYFSAEVLAPAKAWLDRDVARAVVPQRSFTLTHILCAEHQIILAEGAWVETMFTGPEALRRLSPQDRARLKDLLGADYRRQSTARPCVTRKEARLLIDPPAQSQDLPGQEQAVRA